MTTSPHKLAIFDIDGTIAQGGDVSDEILQGFEHLHNLGYTTTISTGRGYVRIREVFGERYNKIISPDALLITEHGTKIVNQDGEVVFAEYMQPEHVVHAVELIRANIEIVRLVWFNPVTPGAKVQVWVYDERDMDEEQEKRGHYAELKHGSLGVLESMLSQHPVSNITVRLRDHVRVQNLKLALTKSPLNLVFLDGNLEFVRNNANKGLAVQYLLHQYGIKAGSLLVAGNAINDVEMIDIEAAHRIVVGPKHEREAVVARLSNTDNLTLMDSPQDLGVWLQSLE